jgi:hypothetical protein
LSKEAVLVEQKSIDLGRQGASSEFQACASQTQASAFGELLAFVLQNKKWWLTPIFMVLLLVGLLIVLGGTGAAPFIYTLF